MNSFGGSFTLHATQCSVYFDKPQKKEIHSLIIVKMSILAYGILAGIYLGTWDTALPLNKPQQRQH